MVVAVVFLVLSITFPVVVKRGVARMVVVVSRGATIEGGWPARCTHAPAASSPCHAASGLTTSDGGRPRWVPLLGFITMIWVHDLKINFAATLPPSPTPPPLTRTQTWLTTPPRFTWDSTRSVYCPKFYLRHIGGCRIHFEKKWLWFGEGSKTFNIYWTFSNWIPYLKPRLTHRWRDNFGNCTFCTHKLFLRFCCVEYLGTDISTNYHFSSKIISFDDNLITLSHSG